jgi:periplasmic protein TonB
MAEPIDILDTPSGLRGSLRWSLGMHTVIFGAMVLYAFWKGPATRMGTMDAMGGAVGIGVVNSIPLPESAGARNPVADNTKAETPRDTEKQLKEQKERDKALEKLLAKDLGTAEKPKNTYKEKRELAKNQLTSAESRVSSPLFRGMVGSGGIGVGSSTLGSQFGAYVEAVQQRISSRWRATEVDPRLKTAPMCIVQFDILRDGRVDNLRVVQGSGNLSLDLSAKRAVEEANPFEPLPQGFTKSSASMEVAFKLQR